MRHTVSARLRAFSILTLVAFAPAASPPAYAQTTTTLPGTCGNAIVEAAEDCDDGDETAVAGQACGAGCRASVCGKPTASAGVKPTAADALFALRTAVGARSCALCVCDADAGGTVNAADALRLLRIAVGQALDLSCVACAALKRRGALLVEDYTPIPEHIREGILAEKDYIEAAGLELAEDGSRVSWPQRGAAGWWVRFGDAYALTVDDGSFEITIPEGGSLAGTVAHPQESDNPLFAIGLAHLSPRDVDPTPLVFEHEMYGPCGMNADESNPDPSVCAEYAPPVSSLIHVGAEPARGEHAHGHANSEAGGAPGHAHTHEHAADNQFGNTEPAFTMGPRGTYPAGGQGCCKDYDGGTYDGGTLHGTILNYYGSTCANYVSSGCCAGELGSLKNSALAAIGLLTPRKCKDVHKNRYCQEVKQGEVSLDTGTNVSFPTTIILNPAIHLGETKTFTIHNNGCFGETGVETVRQEVFGALSGDGFSGGKIDHANPDKTYVPDRAITYTSPRCVGSLLQYAHDSFRFSTDGKWVEYDVQIQNDGLYQFVGSGSVFSALAANRYTFTVAGADQCKGLHVHGRHPCTNAPESVNAGPCGHGIVVPYTPMSRN